MSVPPALEALIDRIEQARGLDDSAARLQGWLRNAVPRGPAEDLLRGEPLGHPLHPALVMLPLGAWASAILADLMGEPAAARKLTGVGCLSALPATLAGGVDWMSTEGPARRVGFVHAAVNDTALAAFTMSWRARRRGRRMRGLTLSLLGGGLVSLGGWLGGHLAYSQGVGVDTTDFARRQGPTARHSVDAVGEPARSEASRRARG